MDEVATDRLVRWRAELKSKCMDIEEKLRPLRAELEATQKELDLVQRLIALRTQPEVPLGQLRTSAEPRARNETSSDIAAAVAEILSQAGGPLHISEIKARYLAAGHAIPGQGTDSNLIAHITRSALFRRVSKGTYTVSSNDDLGVTRPRERKRRR